MGPAVSRLLLVVVLITPIASCAARANLGQSALVVGELALAVDQAERDAFAARLYDEARHQALGKVVLRVLYAARAYERGVAGGADVTTIRTDLVRALDDAARTAVGVPALVTAIGAVRTALGGV